MMKFLLQVQDCGPPDGISANLKTNYLYKIKSDLLSYVEVEPSGKMLGTYVLLETPALDLLSVGNSPTEVKKNLKKKNILEKNKEKITFAPLLGGGGRFWQYRGGKQCYSSLHIPESDFSSCRHSTPWRYRQHR